MPYKPYNRDHILAFAETISDDFRLAEETRGARSRYGEGLLTLEEYCTFDGDQGPRRHPFSALGQCRIQWQETLQSRL